MDKVISWVTLIDGLQNKQCSPKWQNACPSKNCQKMPHPPPMGALSANPMGRAYISRKRFRHSKKKTMVINPFWCKTATRSEVHSTGNMCTCKAYITFSILNIQRHPCLIFTWIPLGKKLPTCGENCLSNKRFGRSSYLPLEKVCFILRKLPMLAPPQVDVNSCAFPPHLFFLRFDADSGHL